MILSILLSNIFDVSPSLILVLGTMRFALLNLAVGVILISDPPRLSAVLSVLACDVDFDSVPSSTDIEEM